MRKNITFLFILYLFTACSKDNTFTTDPSNDGNTLSFKIGGYLDLQASSVSKSNDGNVKLFSKTTQVEGYNIESNFIESSIGNDNGIKNKLKNTSKLANTPLQTNSKYRLIIYESISKKQIYNQIVNSNIITSVPVARNVEYDWVAFTYDTSLDADLNNPAVVSNDIIQSLQVQTVRNKPFMTASGKNVKIISSDPNLVQSNISINFKQKTARVAVKLDLTQLEFLSRITTSRLALQSNKLYTGNYDFFSGTEGDYLANGYSAFNTYTNLTIPTNPAGNLIIFPTPEQNETVNTVKNIIKSNYLYTSKLDAFDDVNVEIRYLGWNYITGSNNPTEKLSYNVNDPAATNFNFKISTHLQYAKSYTFELKLKNGNSSQVGNVWWANFNLAYDPLKNAYYIKDKHTPLSSITRNSSGNNQGFGTIKTIEPVQYIPSSWNTTSNKIDYFQPGYLQMNSPGAYDSNRDICNLIAPIGTWRLPTNLDYSALASSSNYIYNKSYLGYYIPNTVASPNGGVVTFHMHGYLTKPSSGTSWNVIRAGLSQDRALTPAFNVDLPNGVTTNYDAGEGRYLYKNISGGFGYITLYTNGLSQNITGKVNGELTPIDNTIAENQAYSVRCIRDTRP
ncbi:hypothetical protein [Sphingobacterium bovistauri]|uniref:Uncharacterized protein n=1 Tax=Sphingobacterium bovistauri TaxID=2781959 RepID=A0ABS7Z9H5_9SPHI|nr:hypothetical protein [Sphingobacterium bovistauri]MCA5006831.1 hypothetical protein [Sphingobacterium bovistauri]